MNVSNSTLCLLPTKWSKQISLHNFLIMSMSSTCPSSGVSLLRNPSASQLLSNDRFLLNTMLLSNGILCLRNFVWQPVGLSCCSTPLPLSALSSAQFHNKLKTFLFAHSCPHEPVAPNGGTSLALIYTLEFQVIYFVYFISSLAALTIFSIGLLE
jgi:hypothetical protein